MKELYFIGLGLHKLVSAELKPYHKGWMITRIFVPDGFQRDDYDLKVLKLVIADADKEGVVLYLGGQSYQTDYQYVSLGFQTYRGVPRRRPDYKPET